ncbi:MAG TPA: nucleotidyltransferase domain-containing protein [Verrucomicrobiota bacterium]|nr:nucleotidyltransferase domain-containing protein [Verrucomicrobiota bacterium]
MGESQVSLAVFGSVGRSTPRPDSDIDLLIVANSLQNGRLRWMEGFRAVESALQPVATESESKGLNLILSPVQIPRSCTEIVTDQLGIMASHAQRALMRILAKLILSPAA